MLSRVLARSGLLAALPALAVILILLPFQNPSCGAFSHVRHVLDNRFGVGISLSVYEPSPPEVVRAVMDLLSPVPGDVVVDIGSGDGRMVLAAAQRGAVGIGIERREELVWQSRETAALYGIAGAEFVHADAMTVPDTVACATAVVLYLTVDGLEVLAPWLERTLAPGVEVVSHTWSVPGWRPQRVVVVDLPDGSRWPIHLYRLPAADAYVRAAHGAGAR